MSLDTFEQTKTALLSLGGQRVWSLMVSLLGDLAQTGDGTIDGPQLSALMARMDVKPEAVRVALHRLRKDGWIISHKLGRTRRHALTPDSAAETHRASARIYASPTHQADPNWRLALLEDATTFTVSQMAQQGFVPLMPRVYLGSSTSPAPDGALILTGDQAPQWLARQISPHMLEAEYGALVPVLEDADRTLPSGPLSPEQTAILRCLIVHNWRRTVLRHPAVPMQLLPDGWIGHRCHVLVDRLLTRFPAQSLSVTTPM